MSLERQLLHSTRIADKYYPDSLNDEINTLQAREGELDDLVTDRESTIIQFRDLVQGMQR